MSLQHVYFRYNNNDAYALNDINCTFLQNKKYAIMGPSGSGKSTLAKVISGMYRNYEGNVLYDGKELVINYPFHSYPFPKSLAL